MIDNVIDGTNSAYLITGFIIIFVPALMFTIHGIRDGRTVMFVVQAFITAFLVFVVISNLEDFAKSARLLLSDTGDIAVSVVVTAASVVFWLLIIRHFFTKRD